MSFFDKYSFDVSNVQSQLADLNKFLDEKNFPKIKSVSRAFSELSVSFKTSHKSLDEKEIAIIDDINDTIEKVQTQIEKLYDLSTEVDAFEVGKNLTACKQELEQLRDTLDVENVFKEIPNMLQIMIQEKENHIANENKNLSKLETKNKIDRAITLTSLAGTIGGIVLLFTPFVFVGIPLLIVCGISLIGSSLWSNSLTHQMTVTYTKVEEDESKVE